MARTPGSRPLRTLGVLLGLNLLLFGTIAAGVVWSNAQWTPKLALDLAGGAEIVLAPVPIEGKAGKVDQNTINQAVGIIRQRVNGNGVSEAEITTQGQNIVVSLPGKPDPQTKKLVEQSAQLRFRAVLGAQAAQTAPTAPTAPTGPGTTAPTGLATGGSSATASGGATPQTSPAGTTSAQQPASSKGMIVPPGLLQATPNPSGTSSDAATSAATATGTPAAGSATPTPAPTGASDLNWATQPVSPGSSKTYETEFLSLDCAKNVSGGSNDDPAKPLAACSKDGQAKYLLGPAEVLGKNISAASASPEVNSQGQATGTGWQVNLSFDGVGAKQFGQVTTRLAALQGVQNQFAIVLDGLVISAPQTNQAITGGNAQITGSFTEAEATTLANQLKFGALPISFKTLTDQEISATLGSEQLQRGLLAGLIGLVLVVLYSLVQYRALGFLTIASLTVAGAFTYGFVVLLGWRQGYRLSLAGVAGLIVSIGITADSFIVFFERVRDEVRDGRGLIAAVEAAWARARRTILASDTVSFLAAVVLFVLALGSVRGFAFTLGLTTLIDVLVVFLFTKPMVSLLARTTFFGGGHRLSGFDPEHLGRTVVYAGRGRVRAPAGGGTIAERRAARQRATETEPGSGAGSDPGTEGEGGSVIEVEASASSPAGALAGSTKGRDAASVTRPGTGKES